MEVSDKTANREDTTTSKRSADIRLRPTPPPVAPSQQQVSPLKAGEVDDNADFATYLEYLRSYSGLPARQVDVGERYILTVLNSQQQPVLDARVRLFDGERQVFGTVQMRLDDPVIGDHPRGGDRQDDGAGDAQPAVAVHQPGDCRR